MSKKDSISVNEVEILTPLISEQAYHNISRSRNCVMCVCLQEGGVSAEQSKWKKNLKVQLNQVMS